MIKTTVTVTLLSGPMAASAKIRQDEIAKAIQNPLEKINVSY